MDKIESVEELDVFKRAHQVTLRVYEKDLLNFWKISGR